MFGDSSRISSEKLAMYKASGVMHVFAASGSNVAFVIALGWGFLYGVPKRVRVIGTIGVIVLYAALCHGSPPILRATILGMIVLSGKLGKGKVASLRWLLFAALILFFFNPLYLRDTGFQLSFAAAWGIVTLTPWLEGSSGLKRLPQPLRSVTAVTLSAQIATLPILLDAFHRISLVGLITNVFILFLLGAVLQLGLVGTVLSFMPFIPGVFYQASVWLLQFADKILSVCAAFPWSYFWVMDPGIAFYFLWYGFLAIMLMGKVKAWFILRVQMRKGIRIIRYALNSKIITMILDSRLSQRIMCIFRRNSILHSRVFWSKAGPIIFLLIFLMLPVSLGDNRLEITFLDVGQGDCILIRTSRENLLVDTGPKTDYTNAGEKIVVPYLVEKGINYLDFVFITHEDADHLGGAGYVMANIPVGKAALPEVGDRLENDAWQGGLPAEYLQDENKHVSLKAGDSLCFSSGLKIDVLAPVSVITDTDADPNNNSLVLRLNYLGEKVLLTGDMEAEEFKTVADRGGSWDADFIKIPHHGGKSSLDTSWFDQTGPKAVFITVGRNNFGHPSQEVLTYWQERGIPVYRTDIHGTIKLIIDKKGSLIICGR